MVGITALRTAVRAEKAAEKEREASERAWREAWWNTTDALAAIPSSPRADLSAAESLVADTLGVTKRYVSMRRKAGQTFKELEFSERAALIPRFAIAASEANADGQTAAELIAQAEHEGSSLREFNMMLTGRSWTQAPENMTKDERIHVARTELKQRPHEVLADDEVRTAADNASIDIRASQAPPVHPDHVQMKVDQSDKKMADALGLDIPISHLRAAKAEIQMAMLTRDVHGTDDQAFKKALADVEAQLDRAKADATTVKWTSDDRRLAAELGLNI